MYIEKLSHELDRRLSSGFHLIFCLAYRLLDFGKVLTVLPFSTLLYFGVLGPFLGN